MNVGEVVAPDLAEKIKLVTSGGGTSQQVLDTLVDLQDQINVLTGIDGTLGTMAQQDADAVAITGGSINNTVIGNVTPNAGTFTTLTATGQTELGTGSAQFIRAVGGATTPTLSAQGSGASIDLNLNSKGTGAVNLNTGNGTQLKVKDGGASTVNYLTLFGGGTGTGITYQPEGTDSNITLDFITKGTGVYRFATGSFGQRQLQVAHTASAVNFVQVTGAATGGTPTISAQGSDTNPGLNIQGKGFGTIQFLGGNSGTLFQVLGTNGASRNFLRVETGAATFSPIFSAQGTDTNVPLVFQSKGTGAINLAPGSRGVNISNGGTVTAITRTNSGSGYTSIPSIAISAPTTAGGVQATASVTGMTFFGSGPQTINSGGTGYTVNDVLTVAGTTPAGVLTLRVTAVSGGVITAANHAAFGNVTVVPSVPYSVTGGTGSGATFTSLFQVNTQSITNAGSGYVEQPTVTFSGGGGSGAAAYASVGSSTIIRSLGEAGVASIDFHTPASASNNVPALRIRNVNTNTSSNSGFLMMQNSNGYAQIIAQGPAGAGINIAANGSGRINFNTQGTQEVTQLRVENTTSAVNFVQVTGGATGNDPTYSAQGSDANVSLRYLSRGAGEHRFATNTAGNIQFRVIHGGSSVVNYLRVYGSAAGSAPVMDVQGTDTNIDLALTPKGTGRVRFGTFTADMTLVVQGFIEVKDSGGTIRKLAVIA
jgi:hypothetical protein